jgi:hypothetical protein
MRGTTNKLTYLYYNYFTISRKAKFLITLSTVPIIFMEEWAL